MFLIVFMLFFLLFPVCTAQGGGGSFKIANYRRLVAVNHASQCKSTDGSKSGWRQRSVVAVVVVIVVGVVVVVQ